MFFVISQYFNYLEGYFLVNKMINIVFLIIFVILEIIGVVGFVVKLREFLRVLGYKGRTRAQVVAVSEDTVQVGKNQTETYYSPIITFRANNVLYRKTYTYISEPAKQRIGSLIPIRYDIKDPTKFAPEKMTMLFAQLFGFLFMCVGLIIVFSSIIQ